MLETNELNKFIEINLKRYNSIKPKTSSKCYTVLATLNDYKSNELIALASGTQARLRVYPDDIEDCHAESLLKRAYKRYLINRLQYYISISPNLDIAKKNLQQECSTGLVLFVSQFPCGLLNRYLGDEPINETTNELIKRKPGRGQLIDGKIAYVERDRCIDKLKRWILQGLQGQRLGRKLGLKCCIEKILIGDCEQQINFEYKSALNRMAEYLDLPSEHLALIKGVRCRELVYNQDLSPQPESFVWWQQTTSDKNTNGQTTETIIDGRRKGLTKQHAAGDNVSHKLQIGDFRLRQDLDSTILEAARGVDTTTLQ